jgi:hypothetical protein
MDCVYLLQGYCTAQAKVVANRAVSAAGYYKPTREERKNLCNNSTQFKECPRFSAHLMYLNAKGLTKK